MKRKLAMMLSLVGLAASGTAFAADDALLNKLVEKGTLSREDAQSIQAAQPQTPEPPAGLKGLSIGALAYIDYSFGEKNGNGTHFNQFALTRGYINIKKEITPWLRARITPDITQTSTGDWELRMKYLYADFLTPDLGGVLTDNDARVGLGHTPWIDFEETINVYRMQGTMFQERNGIQSSADIGAGFLGNFGGTLTKDQQAEVGYSTPYNGRYGTYHIGVYNGGGYHAAEANQNKSVEARISIRPLPDFAPGLQVSYNGIWGKGNSTANNGQGNNWITNAGMLSYQMKYLVLAGQYVTSIGEQSGKDQNSGKGYSFFGDLRLPFYDKVSAFARYDHWNPGTQSASPGTQLKQNTVIGGLGYRIYGNNMIIADYERVHYDVAGKSDDKKGQVVLQVSF